MASALKRKRGPGEVVDAPKRAKSVKKMQIPISASQFSQSGWQAAFNPQVKTTELITKNETNGDRLHSKDRSQSPEFDEYEKLVQEENDRKQLEKREEKAKKKLLKKVLATTDPSAWKLSEPTGGRQIDVDPVFTEDEKYVA